VKGTGVHSVLLVSWALSVGRKEKGTSVRAGFVWIGIWSAGVDVAVVAGVVRSGNRSGCASTRRESYE